MSIVLRRLSCVALVALVFSAAAQGQSTRPAAPASKPAGVPAAPAPARVYNADIHDSANGDLGGPAAITMTGARNGVCSGKVVVAGSPLQGLKVACSDLCQGEKVIPASQASIRYGAPWDDNPRAPGLVGSDILLEKPLADFAAGAAPVWVTVEVPKTASPGNYTGELTISVTGGGPFKVPVALAVGDWTLPDTQDFRTWMEVIQSPDTLAMEYNVPPWSDKHFAMIGQSLKIIGSIGSRVVYIPLIARANFGNEESMVRWIKKGEKYEYDFTSMEKYLDAVEKNMGKPKIVTLWAWDVYLSTPDENYLKKALADPRAGGVDKAVLEARAALKGKGPPVTVLDPATGKAEMVYLPQYETPEGKALWEPLWKELRQRIEKRGLWNVAMLGMSSDIWPTKEQAQALADLSGGLPWSSSTHDIGWLAPQTASGKGALHGVGYLKYVNAVLQFQMTINPSLPGARTYGWQNPNLVALYWRLGQYNRYLPPDLRNEPVYAITGDRRGLGHIGGDFWEAIKDPKGHRRASIAARYPESGWHSQAINNWVLAPGPDGPVSTVRFEVMREGVQECEARIAIETVLTDARLKARLGDDLARRAQDFLDEHQRNAWRARGAPEEDIEKWGHIPNYRTFEYEIMGYPKPRWIQADGAKWFLKSDWAQRVGRLFSLAGEVTRKAAN